MARSARTRSLRHQIEHDRKFRNAASLAFLKRTYAITRKSLQFDGEAVGRGLARAKLQSKWWADSRVREGVAKARAGEHDEALEFYDCALELYPEHKEAHIARGAAKANQQKYTDAMKCFETALTYSPTNKNAMKYLELTKSALEKSKRLRPSPVERVPKKTDMVLDWNDERERIQSLRGRNQVVEISPDSSSSKKDKKAEKKRMKKERKHEKKEKKSRRE